MYKVILASALVATAQARCTDTQNSEALKTVTAACADAADAKQCCLTIQNLVDCGEFDAATTDAIQKASTTASCGGTTDTVKPTDGTTDTTQPTDDTKPTDGTTDTKPTDDTTDTKPTDGTTDTKPTPTDGTTDTKPTPTDGTTD